MGDLHRIWIMMTLKMKQKTDILLLVFLIISICRYIDAKIPARP